jgi:hypothetical protein
VIGPADFAAVSVAMSFCGFVQSPPEENGGRPGSEATPAAHGETRVPSGTIRASGLVVRIWIQWASSHGLDGSLKFPVNVAPASSSSASPHFAALRAVCRSAPDVTLTTRPGVGVAATDVMKTDRGSSAGPSKLPAAAVICAEPSVATPCSTRAPMARKDSCQKLAGEKCRCLCG